MKIFYREIRALEPRCFFKHVALSLPQTGHLHILCPKLNMYMYVPATHPKIWMCMQGMPNLLTVLSVNFHLPQIKRISMYFCTFTHTYTCVQTRACISWVFLIPSLFTLQFTSVQPLYIILWEYICIYLWMFSRSLKIRINENIISASNIAKASKSQRREKSNRREEGRINSVACSVWLAKLAPAKKARDAVVKRGFTHT